MNYEKLITKCILIVIAIFSISGVLNRVVHGGIKYKIPAPYSTITIPEVDGEYTEAELMDYINSEEQDPLVEVDQYIQNFMSGVPVYRYRNARAFIPYVVAYAEENDLDPLLLAVTISLESSWLPDVVGQMGERGLTQVHGVAARGFDLDAADQQIAAGATWLAKCIHKCDGDVLGGLSMYQAGTSCRPHRGSRKRYKKYLEACKEIRGY